MTEDELSKIAFETGLKVHREMGAGLLESVYEECLFYEFNIQGLYVERQKSIPCMYEEIILDTGFRLDLLLENKLVIEVKSVESLMKLHFSQLMTYLKLSGCKLGLLMNFNTVLFKDGVKRVVLGQL